MAAENEFAAPSSAKGKSRSMKVIIIRQPRGAYERFQLPKSREVVLEAVEDLPKALIRARIASGMTQEGLALRLGLKAQQVQRYEATEYESASFARIRKWFRRQD